MIFVIVIVPHERLQLGLKMLSLLHGLKISHNVKLVVGEIDGVHEVLVELLIDALDIVLRDLTQVAHHVVHVLDRQLVLRLAKRRQEGL